MTEQIDNSSAKDVKDTLYVIDMRLSCAPLRSYKATKRAVWFLTINSKDIASTSKSRIYLSRPLDSTRPAKGEPTRMPIDRFPGFSMKGNEAAAQEALNNGS